MPRLGYSKSRKGCLRCKQRHVKCDEKLPACSACVRHGLPCSLSDADLSIRSPSDGTRTDPGSSQGVPLSSHIHHSPATSSPASALACTPTQPMQDSDPFPYLSNLVRFQEEEQDFRTWTMDLELMHYYDTVSWRTMPRHDEMEDIWRLQLPRIAFSHDYLMHQLLAISAAHLTYLYRTDQDRRTAYALRATQHQNKALQRLQVALPNIDDDNCPALFLTASLLSIGAFAALSESATQRAASKPGIEELLHVLLLLKGMHGILNGHYGTLKASPIAKLIEAGERGSSSPLLAEIMKELTDLGVGPSMRSQSGSGDRREAEGGPAKSDVLREARDSFVYWIRHAVDTVELPELRVLMTWPTRLTDGFMTLLRARDADALAVLACYGRILESMGSSHWYLGGWGECILADIDRGP